MSTSFRTYRLVLVPAAWIATACGGGRTSRAPQTTPAPEPAPAQAIPTPPASQPGGGPAGGSQIGSAAGDSFALWRIGESACPAGQAASGGGARGDTSRADTARATRSRGDTSSGKPAIILRASVGAREIRFASQPRITVRLCGGTLDSVRVVERRNLPKPVVAGTTYRDIFVAVEILGHLDAGCIASTLTRGGTGTAARPCGSLAYSDSAGGARIAPTPP